MAVEPQDIVIIGGGVIGAAIAYYLAKQGAKPLLLERFALCSGSSSACDQAVSMQSKNPGISLELALASRAMFPGLSDELANDLEFCECGGMIAIENEQQLAVMQRFVAGQRQNGLTVELLDGAEARRRQPALAPTILASTFSPLDAKINPMKLTYAYAQAAIRLGAKIDCGTEVKAITVRRAKVEGVVTQDRVISTHLVINAAGIWASQVGALAGLNIPIKPRRGQLIVTEAIPGLVRGELWSARYIVAKHNPELIRQEDPAAAELGVGLSVSVKEDGKLLIGGTREFSGYDAGTTPQAIAAILRHAANVLPALKQVHVIRTFAGLRPYTPDGKPILGPVSGLDGFIMAAGHEGDGIALAPVTGKIMAEYLAAGIRHKAITELSASRFV
ncbi:FAD-dependent oxidoreductase [Sporomusa sp.]|uniref:NAD(P)/FAD-dependent oxidoreductase n=1 Tax=Sporomusa sp. TaxID=2078658 RepID=UPI002CDA6C4E|nr:FAD-dependent oxidoreductase [Sporomusa sp.]HWR44736.1 FAD-dependent oxidoreductase [Sporomusa sp.]